MRNAKACVPVFIESAASVVAIAVAAAILAAIALVPIATRPARATPQFGTQTGLPCTQCHADLTTPTKLTDFGNAFHANGDKVPEKK
jgi:hypothetical protein